MTVAGAPALAPALTRFWQLRERPAPVGLLIGVVAVGIVSAVLMVGQRPGLGVAVAGLLVWLPAAPTMVRRRSIGDLAMAALAVALVAVVAVRDAEWVVVLCALAAVGLAAVAATSARSASAVLVSPVVAAAALVRAVPWAGRGAMALAGGRRRQAVATLRTAVLTALLLLVFGTLFASADTVFSSYLPRLDLGLLPAQVVVALLVALAAATLLHLRLAPPDWTGLPALAPRAASRSEWFVPVVALDALVLSFVLVQVGALLGGHRHVLETAGLTYAEYARQGFAQLVAATALTIVVVLVAAQRAPRSTAAERLWSRVALGTLCVTTLCVVASALRRMDLYVEAFGLTRARLLVVVVEVALGLVFVLFLMAGIRWRARWLPRVLVQLGGVSMLALAAVNPDALIVRHNTTAPLQVPVDVVYLQGLSLDAVPAMAELREPLRPCLLHPRRDRVRAEAPADVRSWNLGRSRALALLAGEPASGTSECPSGRGG